MKPGGVMLKARLDAAVRAIADSEIAAGRESGLQISAFLHGRPLLDLCVGEAVTPSTRFLAYSVGKGVAATVIAAAAIDKSSGKARFSYAEEVSNIWPNFAKNGKGSFNWRCSYPIEWPHDNAVDDGSERGHDLTQPQADCNRTPLPIRLHW